MLVVLSMPLPLRVTVVGLFNALLAMVRVPVRVPDAVGVNVTLTVQEPPPAIDAPQVIVCATSPEAAVVDTAAAADQVASTLPVSGLLEAFSGILANVSAAHD